MIPLPKITLRNYSENAKCCFNSVPTTSLWPYKTSILSRLTIFYRELGSIRHGGARRSATLSQFMWNCLVKDYIVIASKDVAFLFIHPSVGLWELHCPKSLLKIKQLRELPLVLDQRDWVERTTASRVEWSNLALLHSHGWRRLPRRKARCIASAINKPLATKEVDAVNICPGTAALSRGPRKIFTTTPPPFLPFLWKGPAARQVELCAGADVRGCVFADAVLQTRQWDVKWDFTTIITLLRKKATSHSEWMPGRSASPRRRRA